MVDEISFKEFQKLDIRVGKIENAERVDGTEKLVKLLIDIGDEKRELVAGIADVYNVDELYGKQVVVLTNLEAKKIRGIESKGMVLAAIEDGKPILLVPDKEVSAGSRVM